MKEPRPGAAVRTPRAIAKARLIASEWIDAGLDAAAIGPSEWAVLGRDTVLELVREGYPATAANLVCEGGDRPLPAARVIRRGGRSVGVIAVTSGEVEGCTVTEPVHAIRQATALLEPEKVDATVLLWPTRGEEAHRAALQGLDVDFVLDASGRFSGPDLTRAGSSWLLGAGSMTKAVGLLQLEPGERGYFPEGYVATLRAMRVDLERRLHKAEQALVTKGGELYRRQRDSLRRKLDRVVADLEALEAGKAGKLRFQLTTLDGSVPDHPEVQARVEAAKRAWTHLSDASPSEILARPLEGPPDSPYAGARACAPCHPGPTSQWRSTAHARAYTALLRDRRHLDPSCYTCHVTGAVDDEPTVDRPEAAGGLIHVQCEACHGPSRAHAKDPTRTRPPREPNPALCRRCHDGERDEGRFDPATYLPKVSHAKP